MSAGLRGPAAKAVHVADLIFAPGAGPTLAGPAGPVRLNHLAAASGMQLHGDRLFVIADDSHHLGQFGLRGAQPGVVHQWRAGALPLDAAARKRVKPDVEALATLPPFGTFEAGGLLGVPSGSKQRRMGGFFWDLKGEKSHAVDFEQLYRRLESELGADLNIEGAAAAGDALTLLSRGNGTGRTNAVATVSLPEVLAAIGAKEPVPARALRSVLRQELGAIDGVPLGFTDAAPLPNGKVGFAAAAENGGPIDDGLVTGSAMGTLSRDGRVESIQRLDVPPARLGEELAIGAPKIEAMVVAPGPAGTQSPGVEVLLATDNDDPVRAAGVYKAWLPTP